MFEYLLRNHANTIGVIGVFLVLLAYLLLQLNRISSESMNYSLLNTIGSAFILISLYFYWNLASGIIEIAWLVISIYGLIKAVRRWLKLRKSGVEN